MINKNQTITPWRHSSLVQQRTLVDTQWNYTSQNEVKGQVMSTVSSAQLTDHSPGARF